MSRKAVILQSNYIPWKGYFDLIDQADVFIFYDNVQYTTRDWRNRNLIKTPFGLKWLSIPVGTGRSRKICDVYFKDHTWKEDHYRLIKLNYESTPYLMDHSDLLKEIYYNEIENLSEYNRSVIKAIASRLGLQTEFRTSIEVPEGLDKTEKLIYNLKEVEATDYLTGPAAKDYINEDAFKKEGIKVSYIDYNGYRKYQQVYPPFAHQVTVLDLMFHTGRNAINYIKEKEQL